MASPIGPSYNDRHMTKGPVAALSRLPRLADWSAEIGLRVMELSEAAHILGKMGM